MAVGVQGSGWAWLGVNLKSKSLAIAACANQDPLQATTGTLLVYVLIKLRYTRRNLESYYFKFTL